VYFLRANHEVFISILRLYGYLEIRIETIFLQISYQVVCWFQGRGANEKILRSTARFFAKTKQQLGCEEVAGWDSICTVET